MRKGTSKCLIGPQGLTQAWDYAKSEVYFFSLVEEDRVEIEIRIGKPLRFWKERREWTRIRSGGSNNDAKRRLKN